MCILIFTLPWVGRHMKAMHVKVKGQLAGLCEKRPNLREDRDLGPRCNAGIHRTLGMLGVKTFRMWEGCDEGQKVCYRVSDPTPLFGQCE